MQTQAVATEDAVLLAMIGIGRRLRQRLPGDELELTAIWLMRQLEQDGPSRISALAGALELDASTVSRQVRSLEERGLLERGTDPDDGRACQVTVSGCGRAALEAGAARRRTMLGAVLDRWDTDDRDTLGRLLTRLHADLTTPDAPLPETR